MLLIWWTNQKDCEIIGDRVTSVPSYIKEMYTERRQRAGRGKLWISEYKPEHKHIKIVWEHDELSTLLSTHYAGIVVEPYDLDSLLRSISTGQATAGIITDTNLKIFCIEKMRERIKEFERKFDSWSIT
jgi:hypothetical protein